ncbi:hypothetical protein [Devosia sp. Root105]|uniref:hypothetical protein n=1 Tax=Devosia sp. Root105 TaxID=1736423 RepID=UPI0006F84F81|nr:hypothetical protein [Devosia sp. Root105]KQU95035.1 hypothetical protein ASC68_17865 [Devosia sp. Root105]
MKRREVSLGLMALGLSGFVRRSVAQDRASFADLLSPEETGYADFSQIWEPQPGTTIVQVAAAPDLPVGSAAKFSTVMSGAADCDGLFGSAGFINWFNDTVANKGAWKGKRISGTRADFDAFWDRFVADAGARDQVTAMRFMAYMAVFTNEVGGQLQSRSELFGSPPDHPGISYLFDAIPADGVKRKFNKASYNKHKNLQNLPAGKLFNDDVFLKAHGDLALSSNLARTSNDVWLGTDYPKEDYPTNGRPDDCGIILETDFFKFRGRGLIQTTWRSNYRGLVRFVQGYEGDDALVRSFRTRWRGLDPDEVCTTSTNADWDTLFGDAGKAVLGQAIREHSKSTHYNRLADDDSILNGKGIGSLIRMGRSIGGYAGYGELLKHRVGDIVRAL